MTETRNFFNAVVDWRFDGNWYVNGKYVQDVEYISGVFDHLKTIGYTGVTLATNVPVDIKTGKISTLAHVVNGGELPYESIEEHPLPRKTWDIVDLAKQKGLNVFLKLNIVDVNNDNNLMKDNVPSTFSIDEFFSGVTAYEKNLAILSAQHSVDAFYVGVNQFGFDTEPYRQYWVKLFSEIRSVYNGKLIYEANYWDQKSPLYDLSDIISVMFSGEKLSDQRITDPNKIIDLYKPTIDLIKSIYDFYKKPMALVSCPLKVEPLLWCQRGYLGWLESGIRMRTA